MIQQGSAGGLLWTFNNDSGAHYAWHFFGGVVGTSNDGGGSESGSTAMTFYKSTQLPQVGQYHYGEIHFRTAPKDTSVVTLYGQFLTGYASGTSLFPIQVGGVWTSAGAQGLLSRFDITASAGTFTGWIEVWEEAVQP
jgi:hypothetical protein